MGILEQSYKKEMYGILKRRAFTVEMLEAVNLPVGRTLKRGRLTHS